MPEPIATADIEWGLATIRRQARLWELYTNYYSGIHRLAFMTDDWKSEFGSIFSAFADNLCPTVISAVRNRLAVTGFTAPGEEVETARERDPDTGELIVRQRRTLGRVGGEGEPDEADLAWDLWNRNRMDRRQKEIFRNALLGGRSYAFVWPDPQDASKAIVYPNTMEKTAVRYDVEKPNVVALAVKAWLDPDRRARVNLYYADRIEKFVTRSITRGGLPEKAQTFIPFEPDDGTGAIAPHTFGIVPAIEFTFDDGKSRLQDVIPLQDALNKSQADMLVAMEFQAIPQRWIVGFTPEYDALTGKEKVPFKPGVDRIWGVRDPNAKFGQFAAADLEQFVTVHDSYRAEIARVSSTPLHYLLLSGDFPSGEALRAAESPLEAVVADTRDSFGPSVEALMDLGAIVERGPDPDRELSTLWRDSVFRGMKEHAETMEIKRGLGVSKRQGLRELGYSDDEIEMMEEEERETKRASQADSDEGLEPPTPEILARVQAAALAGANGGTPAPPPAA